MKKAILAMLTIVAGTLIIAGASPHRAVAVTDSPVLCEEYPNQPWLCSPNDGTMNDWPYLFGTNWGIDLSDVGTLDPLAEDSATAREGAAASVYGVGVAYCTTRATIRRATVNGRNYARATGTGQCKYLGVPTTRSWEITVCLQKSTNPSLLGWSGVGCHPKSQVTTFIKHQTYRSCNGTTTRYWRAEAMSFSSWPGWTDTRTTVPSNYAILNCG